MRVALTPRSPVRRCCTSSAMRCAARRRSAAGTARAWPRISSLLTTSQALKRTSNRPSASRVTDPANKASAPRPRQSAHWGWLRSSRTPLDSTMRKAPLRSRSARTIAERGWPLRSSSRKRVMARGSCVAPTPEISTLNCARAAGAQAADAQVARARLTLRRWINMAGGQSAPAARRFQGLRSSIKPGLAARPGRKRQPPCWLHRSHRPW